MKHLINLDKTGGIGAVGRNMMEYYSLSCPNDSLDIFSPNGVVIPKGATSVISHAYRVRPVDETTHSIDSLRDFYTPEIEKLEKLIDSVNPDVVSCSGTYTVPWLLLNAAKSRSKKVVVTVDGIIEIEGAAEGANPIYEVMGREFIAPNNISYIFPSELAKNTLEKIHNVSFGDALVSPNGVADVFFQRGKSVRGKRGLEDELKIGFVGRLQPVKNPEYLAKLTKILSDANIPASIYCVTGKLDHRTNKYNNEVSDLLEGVEVSFVPPMNSEELANFYADMDAIVIPSIFETHANVALESLACGTPALVSRNVGSSAVFDEVNLSNFVVDFKKPDEVVSTIDKIRTGEFTVPVQVKKELKERYSWKQVFDKRERFRRGETV